jgi:hypothetical protein
MFTDLYNTPIISDFLDRNFDFLYAFSNSNFTQLTLQKSKIEAVILDRFSEIQVLNFTINQNRGFLLLLYDLCERLELSSCMQLLWYLIEVNRIEVGSRILAANLFSFSISEAPQFLEHYEEICEKLTLALESEEDTNGKVLETFSNYYIAVLGRHEIWIQHLRKKIEQTRGHYNFLSSEYISTLLSFDVTKTQQCTINIQKLKDSLFSRIEINVSEVLDSIAFEVSNYANQIKSISNIKFSDIRQIAVNNCSLHSSLENRGVPPLKTERELFIYLKCFGNMHLAKIMSALKVVPFISIGNEFEIIDWGCGQALATMAVFEYLSNSISRIESSVTLIEPSPLALRRAALHTTVFCPTAKIKTVCKYFDGILPKEIATNPEKVKIHLFSNILDIELFSLQNLKSLISQTQKGINYFICVSPYINDLKTERLNSFMDYFENNYKDTFALLLKETVSKSYNDKYWLCNNNCSKQKITHGNFINCQEYSESYGCVNKWTKIIRVFKVTL